MNFERLFDIIPNYLEKYPWKTDALAGKIDGEWRKYSITEYSSIVNQLSYGLINLGIQKGDKIASISNNRPEWNFIDMAAMQVGAVHVPIYPTIGVGDYKYIFNHAEVKFVFIDGKSLYYKIKDILPECPSIKAVYSFSYHDETKDYQEVIQSGIENPQVEQLEIIKKNIFTNDLATIIYTSGTTGNMKGVMLSHLNIISNVMALIHVPPTGSEGRALSFLPLCHVYERMINYIFQYKGISIYYAENIAKIIENLNEIKADILPTVPRLLEKVYDKIDAKASKLIGFKKIIFKWALHLGLRYNPKGENSLIYNFKLSIARKLVFSKWKAALGGNIKVLISGGAAMQPRLGRLFNAAGIPTLEGYGMTETSPVIALNDWGKNNSYIGTVGPKILNVEIKIAEDGEVLAKGPNVMLGYYKEPQLTAEAIEDGWMHTGDLGVLIEGRFLKITGRKKDLFKTSMGKYIAPTHLEEKLKESPFIETPVVLGENQKYAGALIIPNFEYIREWLKITEINDQKASELILREDVLNKIKDEINIFNKQFGNHEQIKVFRLIADEWTVESGLFTAKLGVRRPKVIEVYKALIDEMFK
ncbi:MAG: long-chain fatty acid--CoA ligase [Bacteroidetes bacterium CG2_30_33_31]|nr:MAG: long-chain fatty acid--CoA ligase [Bacteroidetes bacterium CG2_30_33_31]